MGFVYQRDDALTDSDLVRLHGPSILQSSCEMAIALLCLCLKKEHCGSILSDHREGKRVQALSIEETFRANGTVPMLSVSIGVSSVVQLPNRDIVTDTNGI